MTPPEKPKDLHEQAQEMNTNWWKRKILRQNGRLNEDGTIKPFDDFDPAASIHSIEITTPELRKRLKAHSTKP